MFSVETISRVLTYSTILAQALIFLLLVVKPFRKFLAKHKIRYALIISLVATLGSLFYSEVAGYNPCKLCWYQRIFIYPQPILYAVALWKKDTKNVIKYGLALTIIGGLLALYHYLLQVGIVPNGVCGVVGYSVSCSQRFVMEMGYITIPMMSLSAFALITVLLLTGKKIGTRNN